MAQREKFADVILPLVVTGTFTYRVPDRLGDRANIGMRVIVPFGPRKYYSGIILKLHHSPPAGFKIREIGSVIDPVPVVNTFQLDFWNWVAEYYLCSQGEVMKASIPAGLKLESETFYFLRKIPEKDMHLEPEEHKVVAFLKDRREISLKDMNRKTKIKNPGRWLDNLIAKGILSA